VALRAVGLVRDAASALDRVRAGVAGGDGQLLGVGAAGAQAAEVVGGAEDDVSDVGRVDGGVLVGVAVDLPLLPGPGRNWAMVKAPERGLTALLSKSLSTLRTAANSAGGRSQ
jgi:hypothetical protein